MLIDQEGGIVNTLNSYEHRRARRTVRAEAVCRLGRNLCGVLLGVCLSTRGIHADACSEARSALQRRDLGKAEGLLKQCAAANPNLLGPVLDLCGVYQAQGRGEDLVRTASEGIKRFPAEPRFYLTVANHAGRNGEYERALKVFGEAHRRWPQDAQFREGQVPTSIEGRKRSTKHRTKRPSDTFGRLSPWLRTMWTHV